MFLCRTVLPLERRVGYQSVQWFKALGNVSRCIATSLFYQSLVLDDQTEGSVTSFPKRNW